MGKSVSIIIPAYNAELFIERTIKSVLNQTHSDFELIIVDDGSADNTYELALNAASGDPRIQVMRQTNQRVGAARNTGMRAALGHYVAFLDADDLWHPTTLTKHLGTLAKGVRGSASFCLHRGIDVEDRILYSGVYWPVDSFSVSSHIAMHPVRNGSSMVVDRNLALSVGGFTSQYRSCEDLDFELKVSARSPIRVVHEYLVGYRHSTANMSSNKRHMVEGILGVTTGNLAANPSLSRECIRWTLGRMHEDVAYNALIGGDWKTALRHAFAMAGTDPVSFGFRISEKLYKMVAVRLQRKMSEDPFALKHFMDADPALAGSDSPLDWLRKRRLFHLDRLAAAGNSILEDRNG